MLLAVWMPRGETRGENMGKWSLVLFPHWGNRTTCRFCNCVVFPQFFTNNVAEKNNNGDPARHRTPSICKTYSAPWGIFGDFSVENDSFWLPAVLWIAFVAWLMCSSKLQKETFLFYAWSSMIVAGTLHLLYLLLFK